MNEPMNDFKNDVVRSGQLDNYLCDIQLCGDWAVVTHYYPTPGLWINWCESHYVQHHSEYPQLYNRIAGNLS